MDIPLSFTTLPSANRLKSCNLPPQPSRLWGRRDAHNAVSSAFWLRPPRVRWSGGCTVPGPGRTCAGRTSACGTGVGTKSPRSRVGADHGGRRGGCARRTPPSAWACWWSMGGRLWQACSMWRAGALSRRGRLGIDSLRSSGSAQSPLRRANFTNSCRPGRPSCGP